MMMVLNYQKFLLPLIFISVTLQLSAQSLEFRGQFIGWGNIFDRQKTEIQSGIRYLPSISGSYPVSEHSFLDFEITGNSLATLNYQMNHSTSEYTKSKFYRYWVRYATNQMELRLGNQKINFGKAKLIRPLMWFDQIDPRDPIQFTEGVKAFLFRYYFLNNANIWFWILYENDQRKPCQTF